MKRLRLFFALWPSGSEAEQAAVAADNWLADGSGRLVPQERLHMTLLFLGSVAMNLADAVVDSARAISEPAFELCLDEAACWRKPRIAVFVPSRSPPALESLVARLRESAILAGLRPESRPFRPHVTLARDVAGAKGRPDNLPLRWQIKGFGLYQSVTHATGPEYSLVQHFPLAGAG